MGVDVCQREVPGQVSTAPVTLCHGLPGVDSSGGGAGHGGNRWGHGPAPLCCLPGGKTLRDRAELGVGGRFKHHERLEFSFRPDRGGVWIRSSREGVSGPLPAPSCSFRTQWPLQRYADVAGPLPTGSRNQRLQPTTQSVTPREVSEGPRRPSAQHPEALLSAPNPGGASLGMRLAPCVSGQTILRTEAGAFTAASPTGGLRPGVPFCPGAPGRPGLAVLLMAGRGCHGHPSEDPADGRARMPLTFPQGAY